jgi:hypothetical protein
LAVESSGIGGGGGASARLPCWLNIRIARIGRGFHGLSHGYVASCRRGNPRDARGAARGGTRDGPAGSGASRYAGQDATPAASLAARGTNLLLNPEATAGASSAQGWDAVTIPGWQVASGLPTVVRYGTPGFPKTAESWPANRGNLFAGGAGGTAKLVQQTSVTPNARYDIAGWLGGTKTSAAELTVQFTRKRANSRDRRDRARRETGEARARLPASGRHGSRGRGAGPGDDHPDDHPHRLEWTRRAADRI